MITAHEWEHETMPMRPRRRALFRLLPDPVVVAVWLACGAGIVTGHGWMLWLAIAIGVYALAHRVLDARYGVTCDPADHLWNGVVTQACPYCRDIPLRDLWRAGGAR